MRPLFLILIVVFGVCSGCGRHFRRSNSATVGTCSQGTVIVETWVGDAPLEQPVWKVCLRQTNSGNVEILFTVASSFQESEPGYPRLAVTNGMETVQDSNGSYIFSLSAKRFITNGWSGDVYLGDFRPDKPR
jgi:hypothetical protein